MQKANLNFEGELEQEILYKELVEPIGTRRADFILEGKVLAELKALVNVEAVHIVQALNYLEAYKLELGLLINIGTKILEFKRLILTKNPRNLFICIFSDSDK
jgi:GxxExxY protein